MLLTVSKRLEFSASRRLHVASWTDKENATAFGPETNARYGSGRNYIAYFVFTGPVDPATGMLINISEIKERAEKVLRDGFDHKFLNTYYFTGACEANYWFEFSAARRTMSPHLTAEENARLFGAATAPHGHNYRCRLTFRAEQLDLKWPLVRYDEIDTCVRALRAELDHQYLNEVIGLKERPLTTESLAEYIYERVKSMMPLDRVRLHERADFFAEAWEDNTIFLGLQVPFYTRQIDDATGSGSFARAGRFLC